MIEPAMTYELVEVRSGLPLNFPKAFARSATDLGQ
jgi:hypothetical protein